ncbi:MAG TPA: flagellar basal body P-ring formation chaperone FlgA, partial [Verrucomicrobiae bacterium]|nr:flagellar basal body P-ring formation chaperone FlgA [Verrucomicrobiae bacterium]
SGLSPNFIVRFDLLGEDKASFGSWQTSLQLRLWREVWVARSPVQRGRNLEEAELGKERRDVLAQRDTITDLPADPILWEFTENLMPGAPLTKRSLRAKPLIFRGQMVEGLVKDGAMSISLHVEALEDGQKGQTVRVRNPQSHREFRGKVQDEQTIILSL